MPSINISQELYEQLQERAKEHELSLDEVAEQMLIAYDEEMEDAYEPSSPEELAELLQMEADTDAEEAAGTGVTLEEAMAKIHREIAARRAQQSQKASA